MNEFFERFKINKQVVQAGALYVIYIYGVRKNKNRQYFYCIDRFGVLERKVNLSVEKNIFTMKSLILAQDER